MWEYYSDEHTFETRIERLASFDKGAHIYVGTTLNVRGWNYVSTLYDTVLSAALAVTQLGLQAALVKGAGQFRADWGIRYGDLPKTIPVPSKQPESFNEPFFPPGPPSVELSLGKYGHLTGSTRMDTLGFVDLTRLALGDLTGVCQADLTSPPIRGLDDVVVVLPLELRELSRLGRSTTYRKELTNQLLNKFCVPKDPADDFLAQISAGPTL